MTKIQNNEFENIIRLIYEARNRAFSKVNTELIMLYFSVGKIVSEKISKGLWGDNTVEELAAFINNKIHGLRGFSRRGLYRMMQFHETYNEESECFKAWVNSKPIIVSAVPTQIQNIDLLDNTIVPTMPTQIQNQDAIYSQFITMVLTQIPWSSHLEIISGAKSTEEKLFYLLTSTKEKWSMRELRRQIRSAAFERTMMANKIVSSVSKKLPQGIFRDPYIFEFLDLPKGYSEADLQKALSLNLKNFILEIGKTFTYMGEEYRLQVGNKDYNTDLLFYHRELKCLVMMELKIEEFQPEFLGKLDFYLEALDRDVKRPDENPSIGVLLCKGKDSEVVEYAMARNISPAMIVDYETKLIDKKLLTEKLNELAEFLKLKSSDEEEI